MKLTTVIGHMGRWEPSLAFGFMRPQIRTLPVTLVKAPALTYTTAKTFSHSHRHAPSPASAIGLSEASPRFRLVDAAEET
jgi:hypothetical protein